MNNFKSEWLINLKSDVTEFLNQLRTEECPGFYKYTLSGDIYGLEHKWGLGNSVFATKIYHMIGNLTENEKEKLSSFILSFQKNNGYIFDDFIDKRDIPSRIKTQLKNIIRNGNFSEIRQLSNPPRRVAETRQSIAALIMLNKKPLRPFSDIPENIQETKNYLERLDWNNPWSAGSHFSHLLFFLYYNKKLFNYDKYDKNEVLIDYAIKWVNKLQSEKDGCWHKNEISNQLKVNGAMKILTGLRVVNKLDTLKFTEKIIDTCLETINDQEACSHFNIIYVLYECSRLTDYRNQEIKQYALNKLKNYREYYYPKIGGFSFKKNLSNDYYLGIKLANSKNEPDIHGTVMFLWGITLILKILGLDLKLNEPIN